MTQFASRLSLIAFASASLHGLISGSDFGGSVKLALTAMLLFYGLGIVFGDLARRVVEESVQTEIDHMISQSLSQDSE